MPNQQGWKVGVVQNDPVAELIRLRELLNASEAREQRLREACETVLAIAEDREDGNFDTIMLLMRAALAGEELPE